MSWSLSVYTIESIRCRTRPIGGSTPSFAASGLLREVVEYRRRLVEEHADEKRIADALKNAGTVELPVEESNGLAYTLDFVGVPLSDEGSVFLAEDGSVIAYDENRQRADVLENVAEELREILRFNEYVEAMNTLGLTPRVGLEDIRA